MNIREEYNLIHVSTQICILDIDICLSPLAVCIMVSVSLQSGRSKDLRSDTMILCITWTFLVQSGGINAFTEPQGPDLALL